MIDVKQVSIIRGKPVVSTATINESSIVSIVKDLRMSELLEKTQGLPVCVSKVTLANHTCSEIYVIGPPDGIVDSKLNKKGLILG